MIRECFDITCGVDERVFHMLRKGSSGIRNYENATTGSSFRGHESASFFKARKNEDVAATHQLGNIVPMAEDSDAGMRKHRG